MPETIQEVKARHESRLLAIPGVVSVGIGKDADGHLVIVIGVENEATRNAPSLPRELDGHAVHVQVLGPIRAQ